MGGIVTVCMVAIRMAVLGLARVNSVDDKRLHTVAEDLAQLRVERPHSRWDLRHMSIISECVSWS
jgi:hypothetical protein